MASHAHTGSHTTSSLAALSNYKTDHVARVADDQLREACILLPEPQHTAIDKPVATGCPVEVEVAGPVDRQRQMRDCSQ